MDNELEYLRRENERLRKELEAKQQVNVASPSLINNHELIEDLCRYQEGLCTQQQVKKRWRELIDEKTWDKLGNDGELVRAIETRRVQRIRSGAFKRERAQALVTAAPDVLSGILLDKSASPKHRIDSAKVLDGMSDTGPQTTSPAEHFHIVIDLSGDSKLKSADDVITIDATPRKTLADKIEDDWR
jgi:hypothetical protein